MITGFVCCGSRYNVRYTVMGNGGTTLQSRGFIESPIRDGTNNWQRDESTWDNSHSFMPERFLRTDLNFKGQNFELILFGAGRRICPGSPLAIRMFHLMLGSLIRSFDWKLEDGVRLENMDMEEKFDLTLQKARPLRVVPVAI
ncbi:cytochrome P450 monooxygenase-like protein [Citrus sinensis]|nr:cytochrome P450 monooxygenase-like protein [Citrus sinensis]